MTDIVGTGAHHCARSGTFRRPFRGLTLKSKIPELATLAPGYHFRRTCGCYGTQLLRSADRHALTASDTRYLRARAANRRELSFKFLLALLQGLKTELPAMKLDTELVDVTGDFSALRFVLLELMLQIGNLDGVFGRQPRGSDAERWSACRISGNSTSCRRRRNRPRTRPSNSSRRK